MKQLTFIYRIILFVVMIVSISSCEKEESIQTLEIVGNTKDKIWQVKATGDTIALNYKTNMSISKITVNNPLEWVSFDLKKNQLKIYVEANSNITKRTGSISLLGVEKGTMLANNIITISQDSDKQTAQVKYLYTHFPKLNKEESEFHEENRAYNMVIPQDGGDISFNHIFATNIPREDLEIIAENDEGNKVDWITKTEFITTDKNMVEGVKLTVNKLPDNLDQRTVLITLRDKKFTEALQASINCSQYKELVKLANPEDKIITIPLRPMELALRLKTELTPDDIEFTMISVVKETYGDDVTKEEFYDRIIDPIFQQNYLDDYEENQEIDYYELEEDGDDVILKGMTSTKTDYFMDSFWYNGIDPYIRYIVISNTVNDQKLFIRVQQEQRFEPEEDKFDTYIYFEDDSKKDEISIPQKGGKLKLKSIKTNSGISKTTYPQWVNMKGRLRTIDTYPDISEITTSMQVPPNTSREERTGTFKIYPIDPIRPDLPEAQPLEITLKQAGFTGTYEMKKTRPTDNEFTLANTEGNKSIALKTNLTKEQLNISKTARSGWISYEVRTDRKTGYVKSMTFTCKENSTGKDRSSTYTIKGPEGEGLSDIVLKFNQSK